MTLREKEALMFLLWLGLHCPTVYNVEILNKRLTEFEPEAQLNAIESMIEQGHYFWMNQELIYRNYPSLN